MILNEYRLMPWQKEAQELIAQASRGVLLRRERGDASRLRPGDEVAHTGQHCDHRQPAVTDDRSFFGHPRGLSTLFFTEMWERFSYYGMRAFLILYMTRPSSPAGSAWPIRTRRRSTAPTPGSAWGASIAGGIIGDRWLGQYRSVLLGGIVIMLGHFALVFPPLPFFYAGLALDRHRHGAAETERQHARRVALSAGRRCAATHGFSIFYMGINVGALLGPLVAGYLAQRVDWHIGFASAGVGMALGLVQLAFGQAPSARPPSIASPRQRGAGGQPRRRRDPARPARGRRSGHLRAPSGSAWPPSSSSSCSASCSSPGYEQAGSTLNLFADRYTRLEAFGFSVPVVVVPVGAAVLRHHRWRRSSRGRGRRSARNSRRSAASSRSACSSWACRFSCWCPPAAMAQAGEGIRVSPWWLIASYAISEFGEIVPVSGGHERGDQARPAAHRRADDGRVVPVDRRSATSWPDGWPASSNRCRSPRCSR